MIHERVCSHLAGDEQRDGSLHVSARVLRRPLRVTPAVQCLCLPEQRHVRVHTRRRHLLLQTRLLRSADFVHFHTLSQKAAAGHVLLQP